jgi:amino acid transporter
MADADLSMRDDVEKAAYKTDKNSDDTSPHRGYDKEAQIRRGSVTPHHDGFFSAFTINSFKRNPNARVVTEATDLEGRPLPDQPPAEPALAMKLKPRHLQMIAIGGSIGIFLFKNKDIQV